MKEYPVQRAAVLKPKPDPDTLVFGKTFTDHMFIMDYTAGQGWHDGRIVPYGPLALEPSAMVLHYAQEVFEGLKAYRGPDGGVQLFRPMENVRRINSSCERMCIPPLPEEDALAAIEQLVRLEAGWVPSKPGTSLYIRPFIIATTPSLGVHAAHDYLFCIITCPVGAYYAEGINPVKIYVENEDVRAVKGGTGYTKCGGNYAASIRAGERAEQNGYAQVLWLDGVHRKYIEEVGSMNVMFQVGDTVLTPELTGSVRGACCPDLALLAPLARLLDTDLNTLLSFREELTGAEIAAFTEELYTLAQSRGIDAAFLRAEELLHRWPGCDRLTISLAMTLNGLFFTLGVAEPEPYERRLEPLYRALADSEEPDIRDQALHLLIGRHMRREEYAAAEELLSSLSDRWPHRDALQAGLLRRTGRGEEAAELWERRLLNAATEVYESLVSLQELALQAERLEDGARLAALIEETVERYALIPGVASSGRLQQAAAEGDKTAALSALRDMLEALNRSWDGGGLYPHLLPGTQVAVGSVLLPGLLLELQREPELAFLQDEPEFQALLKRYGGGTH